MLLKKSASVQALSTINVQHRQPSKAAISPIPAMRHAPTIADANLPLLDAALDNQTMIAYLGPRLPLLAQARNMTVSSSQLIDCKPGKRALVRYELTTPQSSTKVVIFGKIYSQLEQLMHVDQVMDMLWRDLFGGHRECSTPQPLGLLPELSMHLYLPAEGTFLDSVLTGKGAAHAMQLTAYWLGALHAHRFPLPKRFDLANELNNLATWAALVGQVYPAMAALADKLLGYLQQQAPLLSLDTATLIHKDFHYRHVLVERGVNVIDFDEMRLGDPNFDLAHFCANLHLLAYRQQGTPHYFSELEHHFLHTYAQRVGQTWLTFVRVNRPLFRFFYIYTCIKLARQLCLGFGPNPVPVGDERRRQVQMILKQGAEQC